MASTAGDMTATIAAVSTRDDVNDALRQRLVGLSLPAPISVVSELRQLALNRLDPEAAGRGPRKRKR